MKIDNAVNFGRAIKVYSDSKVPLSGKKIDNSVFEIGKILNSERSTKYSRQQAQHIRDFFVSVLGDYNGEDGIILKKSASGDVILLSGKDAKAVERLEKKAKYIGQDVAENCIRREIHNRTETNKNGKGDYSLNLRVGSKTKSGFSIFKQISYGITKCSYATKVDGAIKDPKSLSKKDKGQRVISKISYEERSIDI